MEDCANEGLLDAVEGGLDALTAYARDHGEPGAGLLTLLAEARGELELIDQRRVADLSWSIEDLRGQLAGTVAA
jgi:hypothetical protein